MRFQKNGIPAMSKDSIRVGSVVRWSDGDMEMDVTRIKTDRAGRVVKIQVQEPDTWDRYSIGDYEFNRVVVVRY